MSNNVENVNVVEVAISADDLNMLVAAQGKIKTSLQDLGTGHRNLEALKAEAAAIIAKEEKKVLDLSEAVSDAEGVFTTVSRYTASKYEIDLNSKVSMDLVKGVFQVG